MSNYLKELVFGVLFLIVVVLIIGIILYEFIPNQIIPEANVYEKTSDTAKLLAQIEEEKRSDEEDKKEEVLKSYEVTSDDLSTYKQTEYKQGKNNPFYDYTKMKNDEPGSTSSTTATSANSTSANSSTTSDPTTSNNSSSNSSSNNTQNSNNTTNVNNNTNTVDTSSLRDVSDQNSSSK